MDTAERAERATRVAGVRQSDRALLRVTGEDALPWLNGQVSNEVRGLAPGGVVYALVLDGRGKILADVWILGGDGELWLLVPSGRADALMQHFDKYIVMEDVTLTVGSDRAAVEVLGPRADEIAGAGYPVDTLGIGGRLVVVHENEREAMNARLVAAAVALGGCELTSDAAALIRLRGARGAYGADFDDTTYPQEAGLHHSAVSFHKGCYLGQEVVCTLENRGRLSRRLVQVIAASPLTVGSPLEVAGARVGAITSAAVDPEHGVHVGLAYVKRAHAEPGTTLDGGIEVRAAVGATAGQPAARAL